MTSDEAIYVLKNTAWLESAELVGDVTEAVKMAVEALKRETSGDTIDRQAAIDAILEMNTEHRVSWLDCAIDTLDTLPSVQPEIIYCKDCKHWRQQTNYQGTPLSFGFCESENMWCSLYGETTEVAHIDTDDNHYCSYAERRTNGTE